MYKLINSLIKPTLSQIYSGPPTMVSPNKLLVDLLDKTVGCALLGTFASMVWVVVHDSGWHVLRPFTFLQVIRYNCTPSVSVCLDASHRLPLHQDYGEFSGLPLQLLFLTPLFIGHCITVMSNVELCPLHRVFTIIFINRSLDTAQMLCGVHFVWVVILDDHRDICIHSCFQATTSLSPTTLKSQRY